MHKSRQTNSVQQLLLQQKRKTKSENHRVKIIVNTRRWEKIWFSKTLHKSYDTQNKNRDFSSETGSVYTVGSTVGEGGGGGQQVI